MKLAPTQIAALLVFSLFVDASAAAPDGGTAAPLTAAREKLTTARAKLNEALRLIEKEPPSTTDLDAAHAAVGALKDAIDSGAPYEEGDLDYAQAALAARKELRAQRDYVEKRRAKVHIFNHRRAIDLALTNANDAVHRTEAKDASPKDFDDARTATAAAQKAVQEARPFTQEDEAFRTYIAGVDTQIARLDKTLDDRLTSGAVEKQRPLLEASRRALSDAIAGLAKDRSDPQFENADQAAAILTKRLEEGKALEPKDPAYRTDAERARTELGQAKKRMDQLWSETGLARLKADIEPAHQDLVLAGRTLRGARPTTDQLAEARTAASVVRMLIEKFQPQAQRSQAFGQYLGEVQKTLTGVEVDLERRKMDSARAEVTQALRVIEKRAPTDEQFVLATDAITALEKTLETIRLKDPVLTASVAEARAMIRDAKARVGQRRYQVDLQTQRSKVDEARRNATAAVQQIQPPNDAPERMQAADEAVQQLRTVLSEGAALAKKDRDYAQYERETKDRIAELEGRIAGRKIALAAVEGRTVLNESIATAKSKVDAATQPEASDADIEAASQSIEALMQALEARVTLQKQDKGYATQALRAHDEVKRLLDGLEAARKARELRRQTGEALTAGMAAVDAAGAARELKLQKDHLEKAMGLFKSCENVGPSLAQDHPALASLPVVVGGQRTALKDVVALCAQQAQTTQKRLQEVIGLYNFEEGPKKAFISAKGLLGKGKKAEALAQFDECVATGRILEHDRPEMKTQKLEVAGSAMTLGEVIDQCVALRKPLRAK